MYYPGVVNCRMHLVPGRIILLLLLVIMASCTQEPQEEPGGVVSPDREAVAAASGLPQPKTEESLLSCQAMNGMSVHCGYQNPEDLVLVPSGDALIVSEMGEFMLDTPGRLSMLDLETGIRADMTIDWTGANSAWGDESCQLPDVPAFSPHGIDLIKRPDGLHQLLVVNHGAREAIEFFELQPDGDSWALSWRGCALPPGDPFINDVAGLQDGGFFVTHMWDKSTPFEQVAEKFLSGENIGWVWEWQRDSGFRKVPGSDEMMPNGIAVNADNSKIFVNIYLGNKTIRLDRASGKVEGSFEVQQPDNITVDNDGNLWVASHKHDPLGQTCAAVTAGPCLLPYEVVRANPETMAAEVVQQEDGPPMGYGTVALRVGDRVYVGSAHGDRVVSRAITN